MSVRLRAGSPHELAARRTALLARDAERRRDRDAPSIGLAQEGLRLALLAAERPDPAVLGRVSSARHGRQGASVARRGRDVRAGRSLRLWAPSHVRAVVMGEWPHRARCRRRMVARRSMGREADVMEWRRHVRAVDSESRSAQDRRDDADCRGSRRGRQRRLREELRMNEPENPILSRFGSDPEDIARGLREFSKSAVMLSNDRPRLINEHPLQWIGVYRGEVSAKADDLPSLIEELERRGIPPGDTIVRFIDKNQRTLIL